MHISEHSDAPQIATFSAFDTAAEQAKRQKQLEAFDTRAAAYELLKLTESERAAVEWACSRRLRGELTGLRSFYDEAESLAGDTQIAAWLSGPMFRGEGADALRAAVAAAVRLHAKWQDSVRFADLAEVRILWFMRLSLLGLALFSIVHLVLRLSSAA